ncbi:hypothetical protein HBH56_164350 [Parastagonospora nodorum]|uniref:Uncharacterized protein n=2 Tax=Phaeosphaeria nodorum (strain SN15 / ATCC MYA-4574 / FGSC 10173) TaxID=321614 RepID=A0A7U2IB51_PHANO|nr:hypothetical protein SNOG_11932 [Parastagonospora nodorum SN15]KAH3909413.1 hypothetical protein HBH56_164350 [Parastagonospora nodorum]EAT80976.1 hypothetical protein SNOG_11932 [Parastagonospora nodorum SN15]KAH3931844.1 hypothetical protein HBH54_084890 [Parastagonospora nodorum]KAH4095353.1 hypothetical protein HBH46_169460 [Parastagonospora nodorum]KAH4141028.1 hypothetical protein HBH45_073130 [Parastagonospora nodorum]
MLPSSPPSKRSSIDIQNLYNAIDSATPDRLRTLLKNLITTSPANFESIQGELMLQHGALKRAWSENDNDEDDEDDDDDSSEDSGHDNESDNSDGQTDAPANRQRFEICEQCNEEYDVLHNNKKSCQWHEGEQEVDWDGDFWADHDERCHGTIDTPEMRKEHPEGFVWDCCDEPGDAAGCKTSRHRPNRAKRVRI